MEPFQGRAAVDVFEDRFVLVPYYPMTRGSIPFVVLPAYAAGDLGRLVVVSAKLLAVQNRQEVKDREIDSAVTARVFGEDFVPGEVRNDAPHVTVSFYDHHGPSHLVKVTRGYKSLRSSETRSISAGFEWDEVTPELLTEKILEFAALSVDEMDALQS
jgi:hypothetical protein